MKYFLFGVASSAVALTLHSVWFPPKPVVEKCRVEIITAGRVDTLWADVRVGGWVEVERDSPLTVVSISFEKESP